MKMSGSHKKSKRPGKYPFALFFLFLIILTTSCNGTGEIILPVTADYERPPLVEITDIRVGVVAGPYGDMFMEAILPSLEKKGYTATLVYYDNFVLPNTALAENEVDINIFQHYTYLNTFKFQNGLALSAIMEIPTISMCVFSNVYDSIDDIEENTLVAIPNDASNLARALWVLESMNLIAIDVSADRLRTTIDDITFNPYNLQFMPAPAHRLVQHLEFCDISVINGNFALSEGLNPLDALYQEVLSGDYLNVIAVRSEDLNKLFVRDIIEVVNSKTFRDIVTDPDGNYAGFQWPRWLHVAMYGTGG